MGNPNYCTNLVRPGLILSVKDVPKMSTLCFPLYLPRYEEIHKSIPYSLLNPKWRLEPVIALFLYALVFPMFVKVFWRLK